MNSGQKRLWRFTPCFISCYFLYRNQAFALLMLKEILINIHVLNRRAFLNFISFTVFYNQPTDGERVWTLQPPIGSFWSHALFLIPLRTCFIAFSPHRTSDQTETQSKCSCWMGLSYYWEKKAKGFPCFLALLLFLVDTRNVSTGVWMLTRCCQDFGRRRADELLFQRDFFPTHSPAEMDATASAKWIILQPKWFIALNFYISLKMNERKGTRENGFQWGHLVFTFSKTQRFLYTLLCFGWSLFVVMRLPSITTETSLDFPFWICAFPEWHASQKIYPPGMEEAQAAEGEADRALGEGEPGVVVALRAARGCTSSRWPREPGQWPFITRTLSNKTASP